MKPITQGNKLNGLDHLRALAITFVFLYHYRIPIFGHPQWIDDAAKFGWTGVDLFFVLSGFLISSQLFSQIKLVGTISTKAFFLKRIFRILPAFWVVVAIYYYIPAFHEREALAPIWRYLTFTQNLGLNIKTTGTFSHSWSLCVEEHFYFFLPITLVLLLSTKFFKKAYWVLIVLFALGFIIRAYLWNNLVAQYINTDDAWIIWYKYIYYPTYTRLDGLLVGILIAALYQFSTDIWTKISRFGNLLLIIGLVTLTGAYFVCYEENSYYATVFGFPLVALGYGLLVMGAISPTSILYKLNSKVTSFIATISYSIYLTHKGVIHITQGILSNYGVDVNSNTMLVLCIASCIVGALVLNLVIEKPFIKLGKKLISTSST